MKSTLFPIALTVFALNAGLSLDEKKKTEADKDKAQTEQKAPASKTEQKKTSTVPAGGGMVATIGEDGFTDTGLSADMREALSQMVNTSSEGLKEKHLADGTVIVDLEGRFRSAMVVTIGEDGKARGYCYGHAPEEKCAHDTTSVTKPAEKKKEEKKKKEK